MKEFFNKNKKLVYGIISVWAILMLVFLAVLITSRKQVDKFADSISNTDDDKSILPGWNDEEIQNLYKEKWWLEQQLALAKSDSFSLGINLKDSIVQVQLKGTVLFQAKMLARKPEHSFSRVNEKVYRNLFDEISRIDSSSASIPKKPIKRVTAPKVGSEVPDTKTDTLKENRFYWHFITNKGVEVVINGVQQNQDSTYSKIPVAKDIKSFRIGDGLKKPLQPLNTAPLFIWLNDQDAKAIYRALPEETKVIFRD